VQVGAGIRRAIDEGIVKREDLWITSKLWNTFHRREHVEAAARKSLADLGLDYFDLCELPLCQIKCLKFVLIISIIHTDLVHFPIALKFVPFETRYPPEWIHDPTAEHPRLEVDRVPYAQTWGAMELVHSMGLAKHIGVCNLTCAAIMDLLSYAHVKPAVNQVELHPYLVQQPLVDFCQSNGISVTAYSPLGSSSYIELGGDGGHGVGVLKETVITDIAYKYGRTNAQILLRWSVQRGCGVIPKSSKVERIGENMQIFDFNLTEQEV
jgi:diketogulonate reductase-like aldo/keto reductase